MKRAILWMCVKRLSLVVISLIMDFRISSGRATGRTKKRTTRTRTRWESPSADLNEWARPVGSLRAHGYVWEGDLGCLIHTAIS